MQYPASRLAGQLRPLPAYTGYLPRHSVTGSSAPSHIGKLTRANSGFPMYKSKRWYSLYCVKRP